MTILRHRVSYKAHRRIEERTLEASRETFSGERAPEKRPCAAKRFCAKLTDPKMLPAKLRSLRPQGIYISWRSTHGLHSPSGCQVNGVCSEPFRMLGEPWLSLTRRHLRILLVALLIFELVVVAFRLLVVLILQHVRALVWRGGWRVNNQLPS